METRDQKRLVAFLLFGSLQPLPSFFFFIEQIMSPREYPRFSPQGHLLDLLLVFVFTNCHELSGVPQGANGCTGSISTKITYSLCFVTSG